MSEVEKEFWDTKVPIEETYLKEVPFDAIDSRGAIATVWTFLGYKHEVIEILQRLSHRTRAYVYNADGLKGFLVVLDIIKILKDAELNG